MKVFKIILKIILILITVIYAVFFNLAGGAGIIYEAIDNRSAGLLVPDDFTKLAAASGCFFASGILMVTATVMVLHKKGLSVLIAEIPGISACMTGLILIVSQAQKIGFSDENLQPYSQIYLARHLPTLGHFVVILIIALMNYLSYDNRVKRNKKKI
ncbi:MAG: hypothetical protein Q4F95_06245 [Oscillospiraceae bacterium]|nr:hypothetical protein [Oscillospiraceae bacterium]